MTKTSQLVTLFLDENPVPFAAYKPPVKLDIDTARLTDGVHSLKVVARSSDGREGVQSISFTVRNGPSISVIGLAEGDTVSDVIPLTVNAYGSERPDSFVVTASETPKAIPGWVWALVISFLGWGVYYLYSSLVM